MAYRLANSTADTQPSGICTTGHAVDFPRQFDDPRGKPSAGAA